MEYEAKGPFDGLRIANHLIRVTRLSFDIRISDDTIHVCFPEKPEPGVTALVVYSSQKSGTTSSRGIEGITSTDPSYLAKALLAEMNVSTAFEVENIQRDYADIYIPQFVRNGPVVPYGREISTETKRVKGAVLLADMRGFSAWESHAAPESVQKLFEVFSERIAQMQLDNYFTYWKLLGDGVLLVWEDDEETAAAHLAVCAAFDLHKHYWYFRQDSPESVPEGFGIAVACGHLTRYRSQTFFESAVIQDYLGPIITWATRVQSMARAGEVFVNRYVAKSLKDARFSTTRVTGDRLEVGGLKGIPNDQHEVYRVHHRSFGDDWNCFILNRK